MNIIDRFLNAITMYRLTLYVLLGFLAWAALLSLLGLLPFSFSALFVTIVTLCLAGWSANTAFSVVFNVPANVESVWISSLILALIITPSTGVTDLINIFWAAILTMASKYMLAVRNKHIFNPVAFGMVLMAYTVGFAPSWWVGSRLMIPVVLIGGMLITRKIRRTDMVLSFLTLSGFIVSASSLMRGDSFFSAVSRLLLDSPWIFFATIMLTEPLTTPPTKTYRIVYGGLTGLIFAPQFHILSWYPSPESALLLSNLFSYIVSPKEKLFLTLKEKIQLGPNIYDFIFTKQGSIHFIPGQYMEWTLAHTPIDSRGNRRYFTLASSPTEECVRVGVRFYDRPSSYKTALLSLRPGDTLLAGQTAGDFVLPKEMHRPVVFIAGGIGITPFRSMISYMLDTNDQRKSTLLYSNRSISEIIYRDVFDRATTKLQLRTIYTLTDPHQIPSSWNGHVGRIDANMIAAEVPDFLHARYYVSGPNAFVVGMEQQLRTLHIPTSEIITDYFPGFA